MYDENHMYSMVKIEQNFDQFLGNFIEMYPNIFVRKYSRYDYT